MKLPQLISQITNFHVLHQQRLDSVTSSCCSLRDALIIETFRSDYDYDYDYEIRTWEAGTS